MTMLGTSLLTTDDGYNIQRSLRFRSSASAYLSRTPASAGNRKTWTWSGWVKRGSLGTPQFLFANANGVATNGHGEIWFETTNSLWFGGTDDNASYTNAINTNAVFRDTSSWYHIVVVCDTTNATQANRQLIYVNGTVQSCTVTQAVTQNADLQINRATPHMIGNIAYTGGALYFDGYLAEVNFIDGQALTPTSFGETDAVTGVWKPKKYAGTYGTNGFYLPFSDNTSATTLAYDKSGNGNNWTPNNISTTAGATYDSMTDVPTLTSASAANYATINPVMTPQFAQTYYDGNLRCVGGYAYVNAQSTIAVPSGKWYAEAVFTAKASSELSVGINNKAVANYIGNGGETGSVGYWTSGNKTIDGISTAYGATYTVNDVIGVAMDIDSSTVTFYKNGVSQGAISYTFSGNYGFLTGGGGAFAAGDTVIWNFGQRPFSYTPPTGFKALNTFNLPDPTIKKPNQYMDATLYTGNGSTQSITNAGSFQPDFVWAKKRSGAENHELQDSVRGAGKRLASNATDAETNVTAISAFNSNGFSVGNFGTTNESGYTYVGWQWKKGATPGFDIVTYTGNGVNGLTVNHNLGVAPKMMIVKSRSLANHWAVYQANVGANNVLYLDSTMAAYGSSLWWNNTAPTSTTFTVGTSGDVNTSGATYVAYLFAEIAGFSKFGSYTGNGSTDGPFVYCGFRPKYVLIKTSNDTYNWFVFDTARGTYNVMNNAMMPNSSDAEQINSLWNFDILSNGFKCRGTNGNINGNGNTYIFAAFAENPFKYSLAR